MPTQEVGATGVVVLAGGGSRRFGQDKRRLRLWGDGGPTLLEHVVETVTPLCDETVVVLNDPEQWSHLSARIVPDLHPGAGVLGGLYTGLVSCTAPFALVVACDMPLLSVALLAAMLALPRDYDLLVPHTGTVGATRNSLGVEPLHAVYGRACIEPIREALVAGEAQIAAFFPRVRMRLLERTTWAKHDPHGHSFRNINAPEDLQAVLGHLSGAAG